MKKLYTFITLIVFLYLSFFIFTINDVNAASLIQAQGTYSIPRDGLIGEWLLNGNSFDSAGTNNGTITSPVWTSTDIGYQSQSLQSAGSGTTGVTLPSASIGTIGTGNFSISGWFNLPNPGAGKYPIIFGSFNLAVPFEGPTLFFDPFNVNGLGDKIIARVINTNQQASTISASSLYGKWTHFIFQRNGATCQLYINGQLNISFIDSTNIPLPNEVDIYRLDPTQGGTIGSLKSGYRIYNRSLRLDEIQNLYLEGQRQLGRGSYFGSSGFLKGLVAYYDTKGDATDIIGGNNGTVTGATLTTDRFGISNSAYSFDNTLKYITVPNNSVFQVGTGTVSAWIKTNKVTTVPNEEYIITKNDNTPPNDSLYIAVGVLTPGKVGFYNGAWRESTASVNDNNYHFITVSGTSGVSGKIYIDGVLDTSNAFTPFTTPTSVANVMIGGRQPVGNYPNFQGSIGEVGVWNRQLSDSEVKALYEVSSKKYLKSNRNLESAYTPNANTIAYYKLNGNSLDSGWNGYHGVATNVTFSQGVFSQGASFNTASNNCITGGTGANGIIVGTNKLTVSAWVYKTNATDLRSVVSNRQQSGSSYLDFLLTTNTTDGKVLFMTYGQNNGSGVSITGNTPLLLNQWYYVTGTYDGSNLKVYVNGNLDGTLAQTALFGTTPGANIMIGRNSNLSSQQDFAGNIDEVILENKAWSSDQVKDYYNKSKYKFFE